MYAAKLTDGIVEGKVTVYADNEKQARQESREVFASEQRSNLDDVEVLGIAEKHCEHCGSTAGGESVETPGSDTVPTYKCPDCGGTYATTCDCLNPESH